MGSPPIPATSALPALRDVVRLTLVIAFGALLVTGGLVNRNIERHRAELAEMVRAELDSIEPTIVEAAVLGDDVRIQQTLDRHARGPVVRAVRWVDVRGSSLVGLNDAPPEDPAPDWFARQAGLRAAPASREISVGPHRYGQLQVEMSSVGATARVWRNALDDARLVALSATGLLAIALVLLLGRTRLLHAKNAAEAATAALENQINERQRVERALEQSESNMRAVNDSLPVMICRVDAEQRCLYANRAFAEHFDCRSIDVVGKPMRELLGEKVHEEDRPYVGNVLAGRRQRFTRERSGADGMRRWFDCEYLPDVDANGMVAGYYGLFTEISDIKRIELTARSNEAKFRTLTQLSSDYYWEQDEQLRFTVTAARTDGRPGPPPQMRIGMRRWEVPGTEPVNTTWAEHRQVLAARAPFRELLLRRPDTDGQMRYVEVSGAPIFDERRNFTGYRGVAKDVTDRERAVGELRKTIDAVEAASQAKSRFVAAMSHEIRAPMRDVLEKVTLLRATPLDETQRRHIDAAQTSAATLLDVISDIVDIARLDVGQLELEYCEFNLPDLTAGALAAVEDAARAKNLRATCHIDPRLTPQFRGDASRLRQVLHNLLDNAVKFTERGEVVVEVQPAPAAAKSAGPGHIGVLFRVRDTGTGMDEAAQARLFAAFVPANAAPDRLEGSGLGLALCKRLAQLMGGSLSVQSRLNAGSTFSFAVPLQQVDAAARAARTQPLATP